VLTMPRAPRSGARSCAGRPPSSRNARAPARPGHHCAHWCFGSAAAAASAAAAPPLSRRPGRLTSRPPRPPVPASRVVLAPVASTLWPNPAGAAASIAPSVIMAQVCRPRSGLASSLPPPLAAGVPAELLCGCQRAASTTTLASCKPLAMHPSQAAPSASAPLTHAAPPLRRPANPLPPLPPVHSTPRPLIWMCRRPLPSGRRCGASRSTRALWTCGARSSATAAST
jgi:hypothetical protein